MGLREQLGRLLGKPAPGSAALAADRARAQAIHGREATQTRYEQTGTRQRMEAELEAQRTQRAAAATAAAVCAHTALVPRWDSAADIGQEQRASGYTCEACHQRFTAAEGTALRQSEAARVRQQLTP